MIGCGCGMLYCFIYGLLGPKVGRYLDKRGKDVHSLWGVESVMPHLFIASLLCITSFL